MIVSHRSAITASVALVGATLVACVRGSLPARELYRLRPPAAAAAPSTAAGDRTLTAAAGESPGSSPAPDLPLAVEAYVTPGVYAEPHLAYRVGETRYGTYPNREWALPLGTMLATLTADELRRVPLTGGRVDDRPASAPRRGLVWRGTVREFEEVNRGRAVFAAVRLDARLVRAADDSVLWEGAARVESPVTPPRLMGAVVDSLSALAASSVARLVREAAPAIEAAARRAAAQAPPVPR